MLRDNTISAGWGRLSIYFVTPNTTYWTFEKSEVFPKKNKFFLINVSFFSDLTESLNEGAKEHEKEHYLGFID